jgi:hypothetical protein
MQSEAQSCKVWFLDGGMLPNETHVAGAARVLFRETGLPFSSDDLLLVRDEVLSITLADVKKQHVRVLRRLLLGTSLLHIYAPLLRSRQQLTLWRPSWQILASFLLLLRSMGKL